jgi:hypothetical protein
MLRAMRVDVEKVRVQLVADWQEVLRCWLEEDEADRELFQEQMAELEEVCMAQIAARSDARLGQSEVDHLLSTARAVQHWANRNADDLPTHRMRQAG